MTTLNSDVRAVILLAVAVSGMGQGLANAQQCKVAVTQPEQDARVDFRVMVRGTVTLPAQSYLWVFVQVRGQNDYYPQGGGAAQVIDGEWEVLARLGDLKEDVGLQFVITAAVVDDATHRLLVKHVQDASSSGKWALHALPDVKQGCGIRRVIVTRTL